jgi:ribonuclease VapC
VIVDTSALIAVVLKEPGHAPLLSALLDEQGFLPAPAYVEMTRVAAGARMNMLVEASELIDLLLAGPLSILPFGPEHARVAASTNSLHGTGNGQGGTLNLLDLMVYACAKVERRLILCTGRDFANTDAAIHPASRID